MLLPFTRPSRHRIWWNVSGTAKAHPWSAAGNGLTGFDPKELDDLLLGPRTMKSSAVPPLPEDPVSRLGDLQTWACNCRTSLMRFDLADPWTRDPQIRTQRRTLDVLHRAS